MHVVLLAAADFITGTTPPADITSTAPQAPPGAAAALWGLAVLMWGCFLVCLGGIARSGGHLAWAGMKPSHGGGNAVTSLAFSGVGTVVTAAAAVLMTTIAALA